MTKLGFIPVIQGWFNTFKSINVIYNTNKPKKKKKNHMILSVDAGKIFNKFQHLFMIIHSES